MLSAPKTQTGYGRGRVVVAGTGLVFSVGVLALAFAQARGGRPFRIAQTAKFLRESGVVFERWNAFSRVTVSKSSAPDHLWLHIDADAATRMFSGSALAAHPEAPRRFSEVKVSSLVYALRRQGPALIIGPGGGPDVLAALYAGVPRVIGVEVNPIIAHDIMRDRYADYSGNLYGDPRVSVHVDDGRSFIRRSGESYSSIQATLVDTWAASAAGAFTLSENNLYTVEAFTEYLDHLAPSGIISMTRWYLSPPREFLRLVALGRAALERRGVSPAELPSHFFIAADARMATLLVRREPFPDRELVLLAAECAQSGLRVLYSPRDGAGSSDALLAGFLGTPDGATFLRSLPYDATPTSDDRPFFFFTMQRRDFWRLLASAGMDRNNLGLNLLQLLLLASVALTLLLVVAPLLIARRDALRADRSQKLRTLGYFLAIGLGFILTEMGLMQRFILFLGHPLYALAIVLASLLAASGAGSALSPRLTRRLGDAQTIRRVVALVVVLLALYAVGLGPLFRLLLPLPLVARALVAIVLVALLGLPMGMLLPSGVKIASAQGAGMVPWAWGLNGATSVLGSILAVALSMQFGFTVTLVVGMGAYLIAGALFRAGTVQGAPRLDSVHVHVESDFSPPVRKPGVAGPR